MHDSSVTAPSTVDQQLPRRTRVVVVNSASVPPGRPAMATDRPRPRRSGRTRRVVRSVLRARPSAHSGVDLLSPTACTHDGLTAGCHPDRSPRRHDPTGRGRVQVPGVRPAAAVRHSVPAREPLDQACHRQVASVPITHHPASVSPTASASASRGRSTCPAGAGPAPPRSAPCSRPSQSPRATWMQRSRRSRPPSAPGLDRLDGRRRTGARDHGVAETQRAPADGRSGPAGTTTMAAFRATSSTTQTTTYRLRTRRPSGRLLGRRVVAHEPQPTAWC